MSNTILGNNSAPRYFYTEYETEVDDDEIEILEGEYFDEQSILGYRASVPKNSASTSVQLVYYYKAPTTSWFWDYYSGSPYLPVIPLVFACNSSWGITEILNQSINQFTVAGRSDGWFTMNITLKRKLVKNEKICFGIYSDFYGYCLSNLTPVSNNCYFYISSLRRANYNSAAAYVSAQQFISGIRSITGDFEACIYLQYENAVESVAYTRSVSVTVGAATSNTRKAWWKRSLRPGGNITSSLSRKTVWKRNGLSTSLLSAAAYRSNHLKLSFSDSKIIVDGADKRIIFFRNIENIEAVTAWNFRAAHLKIEKSESSNVSDLEHSLLLLMRSVASGGGLAADLNHKADYKRYHEALVDNEEEIIRSGENFRGFSDELDVDALPFASRLFFRTVQTVMGLWDWLRGKIREANNVVTLYCPIWTEVEFECPI